jgi:hypothetical protein
LTNYSDGQIVPVSIIYPIADLFRVYLFFNYSIYVLGMYMATLIIFLLIVIVTFEGNSVGALFGALGTSLVRAVSPAASSLARAASPAASSLARAASPAASSLARSASPVISRAASPTLSRVGAASVSAGQVEDLFIFEF